MSSLYKIHAGTGLSIEVEEKAGRFSLLLDHAENDISALSSGTETVSVCAAWTPLSLTPDDLVKIGLGLIRVASHWSNDQDMLAAVKNNADFATADILRRAVEQ